MRLFVCRSIEELQEQNQKLLAVVRELSDEHELRETETRDSKCVSFLHCTNENADILFMAALHSRCGHYIFVLWFLLSSSFFPSPILSHCRLDVYHCCGLSSNLGCRSETCCTRLAENTGCKKSPRIRHLCTIAQLCWAISSQLKHISTIGKNLVNSNISPTYDYGELRPTSG